MSFVSFILYSSWYDASDLVFVKYGITLNKLCLLALSSYLVLFFMSGLLFIEEQLV